MCWGSLREVRDGSRDIHGGSGRVVGISNSSGMGRDSLKEVEDKSLDSRGCPG